MATLRERQVYRERTGVCPGDQGRGVHLRMAARRPSLPRGDLLRMAAPMCPAGLTCLASYCRAAPAAARQGNGEELPWQS